MLILVGGVLAASCGGGGASAVSSSSAPSSTSEATSTEVTTTTTEVTTTAVVTTVGTTTTSTEPTTTTATLAAGAYQVDQIDTCVIGSSSGGQVNVRSGPGSDHPIVGALAADATGVHTTGWAAPDANGDEWRQIQWGDGTAWVYSEFLTPRACTLGAPRSYCLNATACTDIANLRTGLGADYDIVTTLAPNSVGIQGTGATTLDTQGRLWVQVRHQGQTGWVAGWLLTPQPCNATHCTANPVPLSWTVRRDGIGPVYLGDPVDSVLALLSTTLGEPTFESTVDVCDEWSFGWWDYGLGVTFSQSTGLLKGYGEIVPGLLTPEGIGVSSTVAEVLAAYPAATFGRDDYGEPYYQVGDSTPYYFIWVTPSDPLSGSVIGISVSRWASCI
jgi:uncharacterized protein YgiM (DUF1202 family)